MRCRPIRLLLYSACLVLSLQARAQLEPTVTGNFEGYTFGRLTARIETVTGYRFYYDPADFDSLSIEMTLNRATVRQILDELFQNTDFHYSIDSGKRIFITRHVTIVTTLPARFGGPVSAPGSKGQAVFATDDEQPEKARLKQMLAENRVYDIGARTATVGQGKATVAGYVKDDNTGEPIVGATLFADGSATSVATDQFGYYSLTLPKGRHLIRLTDAGMRDTRRQIVLYSDGRLNIDMQEAVTTLRAAIVSAEKTSNTKSVQMGVNRLNIRTIRQVPVVFGEADVLKVVLTLPGVTSVGEASNGINVRGGSTDQNLTLFDGATIYNPTHLFGFFSSFNPDVVKGIELYKSAIPEKFGGRLSSVLDISMPDGNTKKWSGVAGIGPLTSKLSIEGPIQKDRTTLVAAVRTTYSDWLLNSLPASSAYNNSSANFYDANLRITHRIDEKNTLNIMGYYSADRFRLGNDTTYKYTNASTNLKWKHIFNNRSNALFTAGIDRYQYNISDSRDSTNGFRLGFQIGQTYFRSEFTFAPDNKNQVSYGLSAVYYKLHPGTYSPEGEKSLIVDSTLPAEQGLESAIYLGDQYSVNNRLTISGGLRYSVFNYLGPHDVYNYAPGLPRELNTVIDTAFYSGGKIIKTWSAPEVRISARYAVSENGSIKASYNTLEQYIHMLSNTVSVSPTDIWKLSDAHIRPQHGRQVSFGYYRNFLSNKVETSVELYYKWIDNYLDYKSGANLLLNPHIETDVLETKGKAYGVELLLRKTEGKFNGWLSYTWSRTLLRQDDPLAGQLISNGNWYPASFDKPHNLNFIANYRFSHRYSMSVNMVYSTGRPITLPLAVFDLDGSPGLYYSQRNQYRIPDYFRTDASFIIDGNNRLTQKLHNFWTVGVYNLTGRKNPYSVYFIQENGTIKGYQLSIFGTQIPFITYTIRF
ncbi:MAG TPA: TonB-dependent receptor [Puia sp.]|nr:TonB-dependent receptor [Puia sp.]